MDKQGVYRLLKERDIPCVITETGPLYTVEEMDRADLPERETLAKNLFLHDEKKKRFFLLTVREDLDVDLKKTRRILGVHNLSFVSGTDLKAMLGLEKGSVTPFGLLNDGTRTVEMHFDAYFEGKRISVHPNENTAMVCLETETLEALIREHGNSVSYTDFERIEP